MPVHLQSHWGVPREVPPGPWQEKRNLAAAVRSLIEAVSRSEAGEDVFKRVAEAVAAADADLRSQTGRSLADIVRTGDVLDNPSYFADRSPVMGESNPLSPPLRLVMSDDGVIGEVEFGSAFEGPPGVVHGGHVAAIFDHALGFTWMDDGLVCMTGRLTTSFRSPTPIDKTLRVEVWRTGKRGNQPTAAGRIVVVEDETVTAEAKAIMVPLDADQIYRLMLE